MPIQSFNKATVQLVIGLFSWRTDCTRTSFLSLQSRPTIHHPTPSTQNKKEHLPSPPSVSPYNQWYRRRWKILMRRACSQGEELCASHHLCSYWMTPRPFLKSATNWRWYSLLRSLNSGFRATCSNPIFSITWKKTWLLCEGINSWTEFVFLILTGRDNGSMFSLSSRVLQSNPIYFHCNCIRRIWRSNTTMVISPPLCAPPDCVCMIIFSVRS